tara:strand:+ start:250 stop:765 length:516 start_codon:yes stop_codon:yes gene_type:complete
VKYSKLEHELKKYNLSEVYFGSQGFIISSVDELENEQLGYSKHPDGTDLTGINHGDWLQGWVVFARDADLGDPIFTDTKDENSPVYTAMHGEGEWCPELVSPNLTSFMASLNFLASTTKEKCSRINPNENTITDLNELSNLKNKLNELNKDSSFWSNFIEYHLEWIEESDF